MDIYGIVGAGGFGREVIPVALGMLRQTRRDNDFELVFVVEHGSAAPVNDYPVLTVDDFLARPGHKHFNIAIADHAARARIANGLKARGASPFEVRATNAQFTGPSEIGEGAIFCPFTTVTANTTIGRFFHANIYSYVAHDCRIGDFVTFAPNVHCNGRVVIEDYAYIGTGAIIRQGSDDKPIVIGKGAVVGMGAVVTRSVAPGITVVGNPAAPLAH